MTKKKAKLTKSGRRPAKKARKKAVADVVCTEIVRKEDFTPTRQQFDVYLMSRGGHKTTEIAGWFGVNIRTVQRHIKAVSDWLDETPGIQRAKEEIENLVTASLNVVKLKLAQGSWPVAREILRSTGVLLSEGEDPSGMRQITDRQLIGELIGIIQNFGNATVIGQLKEILSTIAELDAQEIRADYSGVETAAEGGEDKVHDTNEAATE